MHKLLFLTLCLLFFLLLPSFVPQPVDARAGLPPNIPERGLVYDGLYPAAQGPCAGAFEVRTTRRGRTHILCTHGPDEPPTGYAVDRRVEPVKESARSPSAAATVCVGDGVTGNRVQVIYAHASDVPSQYDAYLSSFQQWVAQMDDFFDQSAAKVGGSRRVRFVTDANCTPIIDNVTLSPAGDDNFTNTINELNALGYNRRDRKYVVFMDARVYCGIGTMSFDDSPGSGNNNNIGNTFGRIDAGCWGPYIPAHELMHQFGGVQFSAPHSSGETHCYDAWDNMCRPTNGTPLEILCTETGAGNLFDCNNDDYFTPNPAPGSYLATYWNAADNVFLVDPSAPPPTMRADKLRSGRLRRGNFAPSDYINRGQTVAFEVHFVDDRGSAVGGVDVTVTVVRPDGGTQCTFKATTSSDGLAVGQCEIPKKSPQGQWLGHIKNFNKDGYASDMTNSMLDDDFLVR